MPDCQMCHIRETMQKIMTMLDELPEINDWYDEIVTEVFNAADNAFHQFQDLHYKVPYSPPICPDCGGYDIVPQAADETGGWLQCRECGEFWWHDLTEQEKEYINHA